VVELLYRQFDVVLVVVRRAAAGQAQRQKRQRQPCNHSTSPAYARFQHVPSVKTTVPPGYITRQPKKEGPNGPSIGCVENAKICVSWLADAATRVFADRRRPAPAWSAR